MNTPHHTWSDSPIHEQIRTMNDTPRTDYIVSKCQPPIDAETAFATMNDHAEYLEVKLAAVTEQRDEAREQRDRLAEALRKLADCDWVITLPNRMDAVRTIAREALESLTP